ncbi:HD domain-containing protein [Acidaminobacter sp. JC074]|uniref:HD-GYP domain-containing protein n=1 Tax=Acidaminobacter sp. JC074 TaxID=2530199 RepID=UPI001F10FA82|nr:HD domain-containing phosphohydrolase [Acidaminobacter sp. JC074]MCH4887444.1 HD domain-containing protein [Acidaminobacter sp. JC074]
MTQVQFHKNSKHISRYPDIIPNITKLSHSSKLQMHQIELTKGNFLFIHPVKDPEFYEFLYIVEGKLGVGDQIYDKYDYYIVDKSQEEVIIDILEDTILLSSIPSGKKAYDTNRFKELAEIMEAIQEKDHYTLNHCKRVKSISKLIADELKLHPKDKMNLLKAAFFHDVGKIMVEDQILNKVGKYTPDEYLLMKKHVTFSSEILGSKYPGLVHEIVLEHHERLDGSGYPNGIKDISLLGRILAIADTFDAMTTDRVYKKGKTFSVAIEELKSLSDQYDLDIIMLLEKIIQEKSELLMK